MPATSKAQSRFFHALENAKNNPEYMAKLSPKARKAAEGMSEKSIHDYTKTKQKGLPEHVKKSNVITPEIADILENILNTKGNRSLSPELLKSLGRNKGNSQAQPHIEAIDSIPSNMHHQRFGFAEMDSVPHYKAAKESYIKGFVKRSFERGLDIKKTSVLMQKSGFEKEAFLPALLELAATFGGGALADSAAAAAPRMLAPYLGKQLAAKKLSQGIEEKMLSGTVSPEEILQHKSLQPSPVKNILNKGVDQVANLRKNHPWLPGTLGSMVAPAVVSPVISQFDQAPQMEQPQGY